MNNSNHPIHTMITDIQEIYYTNSICRSLQIEGSVQIMSKNKKNENKNNDTKKNENNEIKNDN